LELLEDVVHGLEIDDRPRLGACLGSGGGDADRPGLQTRCWAQPLGSVGPLFAEFDRG
jgi:hypothetical protein